MTEQISTNIIPTIGRSVADFTAKAFQHNKEITIKLSEQQGKWVVVFFYPADFTFVCPTELEEMAEHYEELKKLNVEILSMSTDTVFVHKAWHDHSPAIKKIQFPMLADPTGKVTRQFGVYIEEEGLARRGTFIINPEGVLVAFEVHDNSIGRSADELVRKIQAAQYVRDHGGEVCPANWKPGKSTLRPGMDLVGKL